MRVSFRRHGIVRLHISRSGEFKDTWLNRYGFIRHPPGETEVTIGDEGCGDFEAVRLRLSVRYDGGIRNVAGKLMEELMTKAADSARLKDILSQPVQIRFAPVSHAPP